VVALDVVIINAPASFAALPRLSAICPGFHLLHYRPVVASDDAPNDLLGTHP